MRVTIDNLDGAGAREYTQAVAAEGRVEVRRALGEVSRCAFVLVEGAQGLPLPVRDAQVVVTADDATVLFDGHVATTPVREYAGEATAGAVYRVRVAAVDGGAARAPEDFVTHAASDGDGVLKIAELKAGDVRELANDVAISGEEEPTTLVEEIFLGDGVTTQFVLREAAFRASERTLLWDDFSAGVLNGSRWVASDPGGKVSLTGAGLTVSGGTGVDGATTVSAAEMVEMGGVVVAELRGVVFGAESDGMLAGFYAGASVLANCFAGFRVRQSGSGTGSVTQCVAVVNGAEAGTVFTPSAGHTYTLRVRMHCPEAQRVPQVYSCMVDGVIETFGSASAVDAPMDVVFEVVDEGLSSDTPATVLYDSGAVSGTIASAPAKCRFVLVNSTNLFGSVASVRLTQPGTMWVVSTLPDGTVQTRLIGGWERELIAR